MTAKKTAKLLAVKRNPMHTPVERGLKKPKDKRVQWSDSGNVYRAGDGDHTVYIPRPGSDHSHIKSFGCGT